MFDISCILRVFWGCLNLIQVLVGLIFFAYACKVVVQSNAPLRSIATFKTYMNWELIILITCFGIGGFLFINGLLGLCVLTEQNSKLTNFYTTISIVFILIMLAATIFLAAYKGPIIKKFEERFNKTLVEEFNGYFSKDKNEFTKDFTTLMIMLKCCGVYGPVDFSNTKNTWDDLVKTPVGCCKYNGTFVQNVILQDNVNDLKKKLLNPDCFERNYLSNETETNTVGCSDRLVEIDKKIPLGLTGVGLVFCAFFVLSLIMHILVGRSPNAQSTIDDVI